MFCILHLEDDADDAFLIERALSEDGLEVSLEHAHNRATFTAALDGPGRLDLILADNTLPDFSALEALALARARHPAIPFICVSGTDSAAQAKTSLAAGATAYVAKNHLKQLASLVRREAELARISAHARGMERLVSAVQELSLARDLDTIMAIVRRAARELTGADGATFVLRDGDFCYYADEYAISPLWKGQRFPLQTCISGWTMLHRKSAVIEDIYADPRIPADAYRPTFVKSLAMVPIRTDAPLGAIGNYWARQRMPTTEEVELLKALANTTAVAMENVQVYAELEQRVKERTRQLEAANRELESFSYAVSHDLGAPLRSIRGFLEILHAEDGEQLSETGKRSVHKIRAATQRMSALIDDLMRLAKVSRDELCIKEVDLSQLAREIVASLAAASPHRTVEVSIADGMRVHADPGLARVLLENLLSNAWKYTSKSSPARVAFDESVRADGSRVFQLRDNGAGFEMQYAHKLFKPFQRLHSDEEFTGSGVGLATVHRILDRHGGQVWAEGKPGQGATFYFTMGNTGRAT